MNKDGLVKRITLFETLDYQDEDMRWEWFENRKDLLHFILVDSRAKETNEYFKKGRGDFLKREFL